MEEKKVSWGFCVGSIAFAFSIPFIVFKVIKALCFKSSLESFKERVVVITGASSGIGEALAHEFYKQGCKVVLCARRRSELERVRMDLLQKHPTVPIHPPIIIQLDLSDLKSLDDKVDEILQITGHIDFLINNGGISNRGSVVNTNNDVFMRVMMVNYFGTVALTKAVLPHMIKRKQGHIIFMNSLQGLVAIPNRSAYAASKHAMKAFSDTLRSEVNQFNINVTVVCPGYVKTDLSMSALTGTGDTHGQMDATTANGYSSDYVAQQTVTAVASRNKEVVLAPLLHRVVVLMRTNMPQLYFFIMAYRARKENS